MSEAKAQKTEVNGWTIRMRQPQGEGPFPVILMLHGWTGDEDAMWVFASRLPPASMLIAPRAPFDAPRGGYSWHPHKAKAWPWVDDFQPAAASLEELLVQANFPQADFSNLCLVGFSQGAALAFSYGLLHPGRLRALAGLSGFLPDGAGLLAMGQPLLDIPVFMAHGTHDELVPISRARQAQQILQQAGAYVSFCEDEVGHKLSASCFRNLEIFFERV